ncbi:MAG TPA: hypothetical protein VFA74_10645 [Terriglobales bacterium]|nr:hypothetical protein [Terriglobales bacterium]
MKQSLALPNLRSHSIKSGLFAGLLTGLLFASLTIQPSAQTAPDSRTQRPTSFGYDKAHEIAFTGTIQEVITQNTPGSPNGLRLLVAGPRGTVNAHLGSLLTKDAQEALHAGAAVQLIGAMEKAHGNDYLLVRQMIVGTRTITVRNVHGFLMPANSSADHFRTQKISQLALDGGAR